MRAKHRKVSCKQGAPRLTVIGFDSCEYAYVLESDTSLELVHFRNTFLQV